MKESITWQKVLENNMPLNVMLNTLPTKGNLVYEYNPFSITFKGISFSKTLCQDIELIISKLLDNLSLLQYL